MSSAVIVTAKRRVISVSGGRWINGCLTGLSDWRYNFKID